MDHNGLCGMSACLHECIDHQEPLYVRAAHGIRRCACIRSQIGASTNGSSHILSRPCEKEAGLLRRPAIMETSGREVCGEEGGQFSLAMPSVALPLLLLASLPLPPTTFFLPLTLYLLTIRSSATIIHARLV